MSECRKCRLTDEILPELKCQICTRYARPPIFLCEIGHVICRSCSKKFTTCTSCKNAIGGVRCIALENLAKKICFPCDYCVKGCTESFTLEKIEEHVEECQYRSYGCPFKLTGYMCTWEGHLSSLESHIDEEHGKAGTKRIISRKYKAVLNNIYTSTSWFQTLFLEGNIFFMYSEKTEHSINSCILYVGPRTKAAKFKYAMTIETQNLEGSATMSFVTKHFETAVKEMFQNCYCPCFNMVLVKQCLDTSQSLRIAIEIMDIPPSK